MLEPSDMAEANGGRRYRWLAIGAALIGVPLAMALVSASVDAPRVADRVINPQSVTLARYAESQLDAGNPAEARDYYEAALVADPGNIAAFIGLARTAERVGRPGQAISYYRRALVLDPANRTAIAGQGRAMVARGAIDRARANLARLQAACRDDACPEVAMLDAAIRATGARTVVARETLVPQPQVTDGAVPPR